VIDLKALLESDSDPSEYELVLLYPNTSQAPPPNQNMPERAKELYSEARQIANDSPRGASALLRVCAEEICEHLDVEGESLYGMIGNLVKENRVPKKIQQALDSLRIVGNDSAHSNAEIRTGDNAEIAKKLFEFANLIVEYLITVPNETEEFFQGLPDNKLDGVEQRDDGN